MRHKLSHLLFIGLLLFAATAQLQAQGNSKTPTPRKAKPADSVSAQVQPKDTAKAMPDTLAVPLPNPGLDLADTEESMGLHQSLKVKFIEGNAGFMSLVALALVLGLAFCIERIIYLSLSEINAKRFMADLDAKISAGDIEGAK